MGAVDKVGISARISPPVAVMPDLLLETAYANQFGVSLHLVCGIDEAGRGPWAGPVCAAAVILDPENLPSGIDDSKKIRESARNAAFDEIMSKAVATGIAMVHAAEIDEINILQATYRAMTQAVAALKLQPSLALIDGNRSPPDMQCACVTIVKGDSLSLSIAAASILAKVTRDRFMAQAEQEYPSYGFARHKGYGVPEHAMALAKLGPCPLHRRSFKPIATLSDGST
jgi:ribonuclease HII